MSPWLEKLKALTLRAGKTGALGVIINNHIQNARQIRQQVDVLGSAFTFISFDQLSDRLKNPARRGKPFCLLTFDDGKKINATETAPELKRLGVPAVFLLVTGWIGSGKAMWFDHHKALTKMGHSGLPSLSYWKSLPWRERDALMDKFITSAGTRADPGDPLVGPMDWSDATDIVKQGFEIGSHTVDHAILTRETREEANRQLEQSRRDIMEAGLPPPRAFAFPNGNWSESLINMIAPCGYEYAFTTVPEWILGGEQNACLPRLYLKDSASQGHVRMKLLASRVKFVLRDPCGGRYTLPRA